MSNLELRSLKRNIQPHESLEHLGDGGYGSVTLVQHSKFGKVAYKKLLASPTLGNSSGDLMDEAQIQEKLRHPNIVVLFETRFEDSNYGLYLEYMMYGPVDKFVKDFKVRWEWKTQIAHDVSLGMLYLHQQNPVIIHGDLKCQNILIGDAYRAKISDFGLARTIQDQSRKGNHKLRGTIEYVAPEYLSDNNSRTKTEKFDVYGFAISVWEIFSEKRPYHDFSDRKLIKILVHAQEERPKITDIVHVDRIPEGILKLVTICWSQNEHDRPPFSAISESLSREMAPIKKQINAACKDLKMILKRF